MQHGEMIILWDLICLLGVLKCKDCDGFMGDLIKREKRTFSCCLQVTKTGNSKNREYCQKGESKQFKSMTCHRI